MSLRPVRQNVTEKNRWLLTGGGKIRCRRCLAISKRTQLQCCRPALKSSRSSKCQFHGGASTGPKTEKGLEAIARSHFKHGQETRDQRLLRSVKTAEHRQVVDIARLVGMIRGQRTRGRKPSTYIPILTLEDANRFRETHPIPRVWPPSGGRVG